LRVYSVLGKQEVSKSHVPALFDQEPTQLVVKGKLKSMAIEVMKLMQPIVIEKVEKANLANVADVLMAYSLVSIDLLDTEAETFKGKMEKAVLDKVILKDYFNAMNSTKIMWALAKATNKDLAPAFNSDVASIILPRADLVIAESIAH
jgi:hypothetical protein